MSQLPMGLILEIRARAKFGGEPIARVARDLKVSRNTVYKYKDMDDFNSLSQASQETGQKPDPEEPLRESDGNTSQKQEGTSILDPYKDTIRAWLEADRSESRKQKHTNTRIYNRLTKELGYTGSRQTVDNYVRMLRDELKVYKKKNAGEGYLNLYHYAGEAQADFGKARFVENGESFDGRFFGISFPFSNGGFAQLTYGENLECVLESLRAIFEYLDGVPTEIWFDNASSIAKVLRDGTRNVNERFLAFAAHYGFMPNFMNPSSPQEKGSIENKIGYIRNNFLVPVPKFSSREEKNESLLKELEDSFSERDRPNSHIKISEFFMEDRRKFHPLPKVPFDTTRTLVVTTDKCGIITLNEGLHKYSSAPCYGSCELKVRLSSSKVEVWTLGQEHIVTHDRLYGGDKEYMQSINYIPYLKYVARKPNAFRNMPFREMMPVALCAHLDSLSNTDRGKALEEISELTDKVGFSAAVTMAADNLKNKTWQTIETMEIMTPPVAPTWDSMGCDLSDYDELLKGVLNNE